MDSTPTPTRSSFGSSALPQLEPGPVEMPTRPRSAQRPSGHRRRAMVEVLDFPAARQSGGARKSDSPGGGFLAAALVDVSPPPTSFSTATETDSAPYSMGRNDRGKVLLVTDDVGLVYSLRLTLEEQRFGVTWANNFWVATSLLHEHSFASLVVDMGEKSVEEKFVPHFVEEYERHSRGKKVFLTHAVTSRAFKRAAERLGHTVMDSSRGANELHDALALPF